MDLSRKEAEDALEFAARDAIANDDRVRIDDVVSAGKEVGLSEDGVRRGLASVESKKEESRNLKLRMSVWAKAAGLGIITLCMVTSLASFVTWSSMSERREKAMARRAQVHDVIERRAIVYAMSGTQTMADISGANNRVYIEMRRYDISARLYNQSTSGPYGYIVLRCSSLPERLPYSNEVSTW